MTIMQSLRKRLSFRKKKDHVPECSKPHQWQEDEKKVRDGTCSFQVRYLGYIEVFDSRGMHICEEAVKALKSQCKSKYQRAVLYVSGDALRVVDEISKSMIVDQTIEKVSFCAPDRSHEKGFAYICRDGTTRRWMCHGFLATKESGERLSHAVGCAFAICLEKKQKRDKETGVTVTYNQSRTSFERTGSFRQTTLTEKIVDPQSAIVAEPVPMRASSNPYAVQRPHATANLLEKQGSFRGFQKLQEISSPFKRALSLRLNELPSTLQRQNAFTVSPTQNGNAKVFYGMKLAAQHQLSSVASRGMHAVGATIPEVSPEQEDSIAQMCQQLTQGLTALTSDDPFAGVPIQGSGRGHTLVHQNSLPALANTHAVLTRQQTLPSSQTFQPVSQAVTNPWVNTSSSQFTPTVSGTTAAHSGATTSSSTHSNNPFSTAAPSNPPLTILNGSRQTFHSSTPGTHSQQQLHQNFQNTSANFHSPFIDTNTTVEANWQQCSQRFKPYSAQNGTIASTPSAVGSLTSWPVTAPPGPATTAPTSVFDPFDVAWAAKSINTSNPNPFGTKSVKQFEVHL